MTRFPVLLEQILRIAQLRPHLISSIKCYAKRAPASPFTSFASVLERFDGIF
jgi:hypothetical protein